MKLSRSIDLRNSAAQSLRALWSRAETNGMTFAEMMAERNTIFSRIAKTPVWVNSYLNGVWDTLSEIYQRRQIHCYTMPNGDIVSSHRNRDDYYERKGIDPQTLSQTAAYSGFYWDTSRGLMPHWVSERMA